MGTVLRIGGIVGVPVTAPAGALVDAIHRQRRTVVGGRRRADDGRRGRDLVFAKLSVRHGVAGGKPGRKNFDRQYGVAQVADRAGDTSAAVLSGVARWWLGIPYVFALSAGGVATIVCVIPRGRLKWDKASRMVTVPGAAAALAS